MIKRLVAHWVERYQVRQWSFGCWNEPNHKAFWTGDPATYFKLYATTAEAIKSVDACLQVGGPVSSGNAWLEDVKAYC